MVAPKLRRRGSWIGVVDTIRSVLSDIETNVADAIDQIGRWGKPGWNYVEVSSNYQASPWELVSVVSEAKILLPVITPQMVGAEICVARNTSDSVTVWPISGSIDGGAYSTPTVNRSRRFVCTKQGWRSDG